MKIEITQEQLDATIKALEFAQDRSEQEAAALFFASRKTEHAHDREMVWNLGLERMQLAHQTSTLVNFFLLL